MKFSQSSFVYFNYSIQDAIRHLANCGYKGIEFWGGRPHMYRHDLDAQLKEIKALLKKYSLTVPNFIPAQYRYPSILCSLNEVVRKDSVRYVSSAIDNAAKLGAPYVSLCPGMGLKGEDLKVAWARLRKSLTELVEYVQGKPVTLIIEPGNRFETNLILTAQDALRMINEIGSDKLGILLDTGHMNLNGENFEETIETIASLENLPLHIHIDDNHGDADTHLVPGEGNIDFLSLVNALKAMDYQGFISAELGFQYTPNPDSAVEKTYHWLVENFEKQSTSTDPEECIST